MIKRAILLKTTLFLLAAGMALPTQARALRQETVESPETHSGLEAALAAGLEQHKTPEWLEPVLRELSAYRTVQEQYLGSLPPLAGFDGLAARSDIRIGQIRSFLETLMRSLVRVTVDPSQARYLEQARQSVRLALNSLPDGVLQLSQARRDLLAKIDAYDQFVWTQVQPPAGGRRLPLLTEVRSALDQPDWRSLRPADFEKAMALALEIKQKLPTGPYDDRADADGNVISAEFGSHWNVLMDQVLNDIQRNWNLFVQFDSPSAAGLEATAQTISEGLAALRQLESRPTQGPSYAWILYNEAAVAALFYLAAPTSAEGELYPTVAVVDTETQERLVAWAAAAGYGAADVTAWNTNYLLSYTAGNREDYDRASEAAERIVRDRVEGSARLRRLYGLPDVREKFGDKIRLILNAFGLSFGPGMTLERVIDALYAAAQA
ncbi:MAG: hypothetical protein COV76_08525 [Candidatus Omnitrophica bacterium CG11_big_fil_rev_8_21_14_0_20_64_10]|nr:MAG: hypothetical protein COV76_08525 [Candidatus Omnitrophica bacterium CG11_big_fil_rev_8_21_14_0_20_64_10]